MQRYFAIIVLVLALTAGVPARAVPVTPHDADALIQAFLVMVKMWNAMQGGGNWDFSSDWAGGGSPYAPYGPYQHWPQPGWPGLGGQPYYSPTYPGATSPYSHPATPRPGQGGALGLDGLWLGNDGTLMLLRGNRFVFQTADQAYQVGTFRAYGNRFTAQTTYPRTIQHYRLERRHGMLGLQDTYGRIKVFRRLLSGSHF